jgi:hypothetical protein
MIIGKKNRLSSKKRMGKNPNETKNKILENTRVILADC